MKLIEIISKSLLLLYEHNENKQSILLPMFKEFENYGVTHRDKIMSALVLLNELKMVEYKSIDSIEVYAKIMGRGIIIIEKFGKDENLIRQEIERVSINSGNIINSNIAINSNEIKQEIKI